ncbi:MAG: branched-chain amino acid aminotransferase [Prolixibacteraceae bacterium]|jgi:branched-chain amino acid aminotransferase|nr:branched-chain amino acid aminotransferase [Prolixibacteraceae bacterium]
MENLDWKNLGFGYSDTNSNVRCYYRDGKWGELEISKSNEITMHMSATCLHYGQEAFEGLKAYRGKDGKIRVFRIEENAKRMQSSARGILMPELPVEKFKEAVFKAIKLNQEYVPPHGSGATLYVRPLLIGVGPQIGVKPATEYLFIVFVMPVGPYFKEGFKPTDYVIYREYDRAAPQGTGTIKVGGNYAASLRAGVRAHSEGYSAVLYLDAREKKYLDECGPANFFGIKGNSYVTPKSESILPSITNKSLRQLAKDMGMTVEERRVPVEELAEFSEAGACGTAAVISPFRSVYDADKDIRYTYGNDPGEVSQKLYNKLINIQCGCEEDPHGWVSIVE